MNHRTKAFAAMSNYAQQVAVGMIEYCIEHGLRMGMDEGKMPSGRKMVFRKHLEKFVKTCASPQDDAVPAVTEISLCEVPHIMLRPGQLYRFVVMPGCEKCAAAAAPYASETNPTKQ